MNKLQLLKGLGAVALLAASATATASPCVGICDVYLVSDQNHSASQGNVKNFFFGGQGVQGYNGGTGQPISDATWTWNTATGVLTQTGGTLWAGTYTGNNPTTGTSIWEDKVTGLVIDTVNGTTTAATYECREGNFGPPNSANCPGLGLGGDGLLNSTTTYNNGSADCSNVNLGGDDIQSGVMRGLRERAGAGPCQQTDGALDMIHVLSNNLGVSGGLLILANAGSRFPAGGYAGTAAGCFPTAAGGPPTIQSGTSCGDAHWLTFVPVPGAVWLFGSALGMLGLRRRFTA